MDILMSTIRDVMISSSLRTNCIRVFDKELLLASFALYSPVMLWIFINVFQSSAAGLSHISDLCLSLSACPSSNVPANKLHFSLCAATAAPLLRDNFLSMLCIYF